MRLLVGVALGLLVAGSARVAQADQRSFAVSWQAPAECPDADAVERYVAQVVGDAASGPVTVRAAGTVTRNADGRYSASVELDTGAARPSVRALDAGDCEALAQAAALLIALAIREQAAPTPAPPPAPAPAKPAPPPEPPADPPMRAAARPFLGASVVFDLGSTPNVTAGVSVGGGVRWAWLLLEPSVAYYAPRSEGVPLRSAVGADFTLATAGLRACVAPSRGNVWLAPCLGGGADWLRGVGFGARIPHSGSAWSIVGRAGLLLGWDISSIISARAGLEAVLPLARPKFDVDGVGVVFQRKAASARAELGFDVHF